MLAVSKRVDPAGQDERLIELLPRLQRVPLYRDRLHNHSALLDPAHLSQIPFITKQDMRQGFPHNFLPVDVALQSMLERHEVEVEYTSGTSEERTPVLLPAGWWDEQEQRALRLNAFVARVLDQHPGARRATITTPACNGRSCPVVWQSVSRRTFGSTRFVNLARIPFALSVSELQRMAREIADWSPHFLDVSPVHGAWFALYCERRGIRFPSLRFILCSYEFVSVVHRRLLERAFGVPVFNLYGSTETGHLLMEDEDGQMRPSGETAFLEVMEPDDRHVGDLVVTTLSNHLMPLLRYRIGDLVERREHPYRSVYRVHGRARDTLRDNQAERVTTLDVDECFTGVSGIAHYQLRQQPEGSFLLRYIPERQSPSAADLNALLSKLKRVLQCPQEIAIEPVALLAPSPSGKFRLTHPVETPGLPGMFVLDKLSLNHK